MLIFYLTALCGIWHKYLPPCKLGACSLQNTELGEVSFCREGVWRREIAAPRIQIGGVLTLHSGRLSPAEKAHPYKSSRNLVGDGFNCGHSDKSDLVKCHKVV